MFDLGLGCGYKGRLSWMVIKGGNDGERRKLRDDASIEQSCKRCGHLDFTLGNSVEHVLRSHIGCVLNGGDLVQSVGTGCNQIHGGRLIDVYRLGRYHDHVHIWVGGCLRWNIASASGEDSLVRISHGNLDVGIVVDQGRDLGRVLQSEFLVLEVVCVGIAVVHDVRTQILQWAIHRISHCKGIGGLVHRRDQQHGRSHNQRQGADLCSCRH
mmetsp:Transcript_17897/g.31109  ORF Transcript_17897/g.31109 Transcript_17897/m.31109 type:complete len:212 (+) Transcript_17897:1339-1974(+)